MKTYWTLVAAAVVAFTAAALPARADDRAVVEAFYSQLLTKPASSNIAANAQKIIAPDWLSLGNNSGKGKTRAQFIRQMSGFGKAVPNLKWVPQEILRQGNRYVVRARATGTPTGKLFGIPPSGKSFDIMSIDIHTVENGMIVRSYHIEDWASAIRQLRAK